MGSCNVSLTPPHLRVRSEVCGINVGREEERPYYLLNDEGDIAGYGVAATDRCMLTYMVRLAQNHAVRVVLGVRGREIFSSQMFAVP